MTGPLAPLFAQVREEHELGLQAEWWGFSERVEARRRFDAALSAIERHVQEQGELLERLLDYGASGYQEALARRSAWVSSQLAALPAREKEEE